MARAAPTEGPPSITTVGNGDLATRIEHPGADIEVGNDLLNGLVPENPPWLLPCLGRIVNSPQQHPAWRNYAVQHLARHVEIHGGGEALAIIVSAVDIPEPEVQEVAIFSLARLARDSSRDDIRSLAESAIARGIATGNAVLVRDASVRAIGELGDRSHVDVLLRLAGDPAEAPQVRLAAIDVLGAWRERAALPVLQRNADADPIAVLATGSRQAIHRIEGTPAP